MTSMTTKTQIKNALAKAGLIDANTRIQGRGADWSLSTSRQDVADFLADMGHSVRSCIGGEWWNVTGAAFGSRVSPATRELIWNNMD